MIWDVLILTQPSRAEFLKRLMDSLAPQVAAVQGVDWLLRIFDKGMSLGENRQAMREASTADYVSFVDDDDCVADDYVARILPLLDRDYVGFKVAVYEDGVPQKPAYHSLLCNRWYANEWASYRDLSHINPIKRELALKVPMWGGFAEDSRWANELRTLGVVRTEHYIEDVMYHYYSRTDKTDGVPWEAPLTAGKCPACGSHATVLVGFKEHACNACGLWY